jgi:hypothetical protein
MLDERELTQAMVDAPVGGLGVLPTIVWAAQGSEAVLHVDTQ